MNRRRILTVCCWLACFAVIQARLHAEIERPPNVLFIAVDDLRPQLACYDVPGIKTPHIDRLAARGTVFDRAYCQVAVCRATRVSLLTGSRPDTTEIWSNGARVKSFRQSMPGVVTLPEHFKNHGYHSRSLGKIFHGAFQVRSQWNDSASWSVPEWWPGPRYYYTPEGIEVARGVFSKRAKQLGQPVDEWVHHFVLGLSYEAPEVADNVLYDGQLADRAVAVLGEIREQPFFLGVGFIRPHLPFIAPKKYWDMYPPEDVQVAENPYAPQNVPKVALTNWGHPRTYTDFPNEGPPDEELVLELTRGYSACVTYIDAQIGRVLDELKRLGLQENTIVVFWGDHGYHLGENAIWGKATNFELSTRVPLIVSVPKAKAPGAKTGALVEFVDIYPTLCEAAGLPLPEHLEGTSFATLLDRPDTPWKQAAFSQFPRGSVMGQSMRTDRYRFTLWRDAKTRTQVVATELYDHQTDPAENRNVANRPENAAIVKQLTEQLEAGWQAAVPR